MSYLDTLWRWRRFIVINVILVAALTIVITFLMPKWYKSTASILSPKDSGLLGGLGAGASFLSDLAGGAIGSLSTAPEGAYNYFAILGSRTVMQNVAEKFDLMTVYDIGDSSMEKTLEALSGNVAFEEQDDEFITVEVLDKDPKRAADMANYFVHLLNEMSIRLATEEARSNREFIERQLRTTEAVLRNSEDSLRAYQEETGTIVAIDPTSPGESPIAELYALKAKKEIELAILQKTASEDNALVRQLQLELSEISKKVATFPIMGIESLRLYRGILIQQKILEFLVPLYEQAKVDEQKDIPVLLVLDHAISAELKTKPQRALIVLVVTTLVCILLISVVFPLDTLLRSAQDEGAVQQYIIGMTRKIAARYKVRIS